ncbi:MAG TPA: Stp1/IreP family PP2C-type Ser/Thr phosphatase [Acidimicrobiia bacterium]
MKLVAGKQTDKGRVREGNEDGYVAVDRLGLFAVADGMGGHQAGEVASATALEALRAEVENGAPVRDAIASANTAVLERAAADESLRGMGTTMTAGTLAAGNTFLVGHVGDSRAYLFRDGDLSQVTEDHSLVEELVREGELTPEQAEVHPQRSIITRALGIEPGVQVDLYTLDLHQGDRLLICSDGLTGMVRTDDIAGILRREPDPQRAANQLVEAANAAGGEDNITALVIDAVSDDGSGAATETPEPEAHPGEERADASEPGAEPDAPAPRRHRGLGRRVLRVLIWVIPVLVVLALAFSAVGWYARRTYFVEIDRGRVTVFKGVPDGLLGWDPTLEERTDLEESDLTEAERSDLEGGKRFSSRESADRFVERLEENVAERTAATSTTTTTTTTTVPAAPAPPAP